MFACADGGCVGPEVGEFVLAVEASPTMPTVAIATWATGEPGTSYIEFGPDPDYGFRTAEGTESTTQHRWVVPGFPSDSSWHVRAHSIVNGEELVSADTVFTNGSAPTNIPAFTISGERQHPGWIVTTLLGSDPFVVIMNSDGNYTWAYEGTHSQVFTRARISLDGQAVVFNTFAEDRAIDEGKIVRVSFDGATVTEVKTPLAHHDFVELPEGGYAFIAIDVREYDGRNIVGDAIVEVSPDGADTRVAWNSWDWWEPTDDHLPENFYPQGEDWLHGNALEYDPVERTYLLSLHNRNSIVLVDRDSGEIGWELGGSASDFALTSGTAFEHQHGPSFFGDELFVFDNRAEGCCSFGRAYALDKNAMTYEETWSVAGANDERVQQFGQVTPYDDGATLIDWGSAGYFSELDADDEQRWRADVAFGTIPTYFLAVEQIGMATEG